MPEWLKEFWDGLDKNHNQISIIFALFAMISWKDSRDALCRIIKMIYEWFKKLWNKIKQLIKNLRSKIINKLHEIAVGKENLELLKELETLRGNEWAIKFLEEFKGWENTIGGISLNIRYDALMTLMEVYRLELDPQIHDPSPYSDSDSYNYLEEVCKKNVTYIRNAQVDIFQKIIKNIVENNYNCYNNIHNKIDTLDKKNKYYIP